MPRASRAEVYDPAEVAIVHCVQRCVRRAYLAGSDPISGRNFEFRREWIRRRLELLASVFGIDVLAYAVLCNHLHVVLRTRPDVAAAWSDSELALRWLRLFPGRRLEEQLAEPTDADLQMLLANPERLLEIRRRLSDLSWFMRSLCEPIARLANRQDQCTGRFWEGRFKAQRIADEAALLACSMYVDLNPVRAALALSPEQAVHTSAYDRIAALQGRQIDSAAADLVVIEAKAAGEKIRSTSVQELAKERRRRKHSRGGKRVLRDAWLSPLTLEAGSSSLDPQKSGTSTRASDKGFLPLSVREYLKLLDWTGRQGRLDKRGQVPSSLAPILGRLGIDAGMWCDLVWNFKRYFRSSAGRPQSLQAEAQRRGRHWVQGQRAAEACFASG